MNRLERYYFINEDGSEDKIIFSIDCYEKILYHALRDYNIDYKLEFSAMCMFFILHRGKTNASKQKFQIF